MSEPAEMDDRTLRRVFREQWAELSRVEDELEVVPVGSPIRGQVEFAHALSVEICDRLRAEIKSRRALYAAVERVFGEEIDDPRTI